jgi:hypothetical protein
VNHFAQLLRDVRDRDVPLSMILLNARMLAVDLSSRKFLAWILAEMNGYQCPTNEVPAYRVVQTNSRGDFIGAIHELTKNW